MATINTTQRSETVDHVSELVDRHFDVVDGELRIGGIAVRALAARHGTPLFVYDQRVLEYQWRALRDALPQPYEIFYSVKANPSQAFLRFFLSRGCGLEIASSGELTQSLAAGCQPERIFFAGPAKTDAELAAALECGIGEIHVESLHEVRRLGELASRLGRQQRIAVRVNPSADVEGGGMRMGGRPVQFGIDEDQLEGVFDVIRSYACLDLTGVHLFMGTQILDAQLVVRQYRAALDIARHVARSMGKPLETIDFGGGFGVPYFAHERELDLELLSQGLRPLVEELSEDRFLSGARLVVEPGRFLSAPAGIYIASVVDVKTSRGKKFVITDGGMHHHLAASGNLGQTIKRNYPVAVIDKLDQPRQETVDVVGPLCTPLDVLARAIDLPPAEIGDLIGVFQSGAYARAASPLGFLSRRSPPEVLIDDSCDRVIRRRGTDDDYLAAQLGPSESTAAH